jgi:protein gp37
MPDARVRENPWTERIWLGASVENRNALGRLDALRASRARVRFLSVEPSSRISARSTSASTG